MLKIFTIFVLGLMWINYPQTAVCLEPLPYSFHSKHNLNLNKMQEEIWKDVKGYEGLYQASNLGRIFSIKTNKILKYTLADNYTQYGLYKNKIHKKHKGHRLVLSSFVENKENKETINHINGIKTDNTLSNLEWSTRSENVLHSYKTGLKKPSYGGKGLLGYDNKSSIEVLQYDKEFNFIAKFGGMAEAERKTKIHNSAICMVCNGKRKSAGGFIWRKNKI